jgi:hypothetical protein
VNVGAHAPGAALIGILLMIGAVVLGVKTTVTHYTF